MKKCVRELTSETSLLSLSGTTQFHDKERNSHENRRNQKEQIEYIETSSNEHLNFDYENGLVKKITNLRDVSQKVTYEYKNNIGNCKTIVEVLS